MTTSEGAFGVPNSAPSKRTDAEHRDFARQLAVEKARLVAAQAVAKIGSWDHDLATGVVTWSEETHRIFGTNAATFTPTYRSFLESVHTDDRAKVAIGVPASIERPGPHSVEYRVILPSGEIKFLEEKWVIIANELGTPLKAVGTCQDITEKKLAERALRDSEERFASAFKHAPIGMALISPEGRWLMVNQALCDMFGIAEIDLVGRSIDDVTHPDDLELTRSYRRQGNSGENQSFSFRKRYIHALGHSITVIVTSSLLRDTSGGPRYFVSQIQNITERERSEQAIALQAQLLRASEEKFRTLAEAVPQMVWIAGPDGSNTYVNRLWVEYTGLTLDEGLGEGWKIPFHPDDLERVIHDWKQAVACGGTFASEYRLRGADGKYRWWMNRGVPRRDDTGMIVEWIGSCTDIHDLKLSQLEFTRVNRALKLIVGASSAVVQIKVESELLSEICRIGVEVGGYAMGWIGFAMDDEAKSIDPMACEGTGDGYLTAPKATWDENSASGQGPDGVVIRTGEAVTSEGFGIDPSLEPWRKGAVLRGYAGVVALPLRNAKRAFGVLVLCSTTFGPPTQEELELLKKFADGVSFGINRLRARRDVEASHPGGSVRPSNRGCILAPDSLAADA